MFGNINTYCNINLSTESGGNCTFSINHPPPHADSQQITTVVPTPQLPISVPQLPASVPQLPDAFHFSASAPAPTPTPTLTPTPEQSPLSVKFKRIPAALVCDSVLSVSLMCRQCCHYSQLLTIN